MEKSSEGRNDGNGEKNGKKFETDSLRKGKLEFFRKQRQ